MATQFANSVKTFEELTPHQLAAVQTAQNAEILEAQIQTNILLALSLLNNKQSLSPENQELVQKILEENKAKLAALEQIPTANKELLYYCM